ncbi:MAG: sulfatase [Armatimonadota bacterium]|nr:sulfatase [Armatimonadota bacterium]
MNVILIITDTMRRDHLGVYGNERVRTPNLDRLAEQACIFENAYAASFPTVPNRMDIMTGRFTFIEAGWQPLPRQATVLSEVLGAAGYTTMMIADTPHILANGYGYDRGFSGWQWIRGQENDRWRTAPAQPPLPASPDKLRNPPTVKQHLRNTWHRAGEEDCFCARTMQAACEWLEENADRDFLLYVDTFDPHEPWDAPQQYVDLYDPGYAGERVTYPVYGRTDYISERELEHMRALYAAEVTLVDAWVGRLIERVEELGLTDDTAIIYTTDHGFYHGEHGWTGKSFIWQGGSADMPLYSEVARIPLLIRLPQGERARRLQCFAQAPDIMPTILDLLGVDTPETVQGTSLVPVMLGGRDHTRPLAVSTPSLAIAPSGGRPTTIVEGGWALVYYGAPDGPLMDHLQRDVDSIPRHAEVPTGRVPEPELYDLAHDPEQKYNVYAENRDIAVKLHADHVHLLESLGMSEEYLCHRRALEPGHTLGGLFDTG